MEGARSFWKANEQEELDSDTQTLKLGGGNGQIRFRSPSAAELLDAQQQVQMEKSLKRNRQHETFSDKFQRWRGAMLLVSVPLLLITFVLFLMPTTSTPDSILWCIICIFWMLLIQVEDQGLSMQVVMRLCISNHPCTRGLIRLKATKNDGCD